MLNRKNGVKNPGTSGSDNNWMLSLHFVTCTSVALRSKLNGLPLPHIAKTADKLAKLFCLHVNALLQSKVMQVNHLGKVAVWQGQALPH